MILTKDNLLRFVRGKKYLTPTHIAESFKTNTMIASAALSELSKKNNSNNLSLNRFYTILL